jgi:ABC-2 type transport system permease protein
MNGYLAIFCTRSAALFQYRAAAFAGLCTQFFWSLIFVMVYKAFYAGTSAQEPLSLAQTLTFVWLGQSIMPLLPWRSDRMIETQIRSGSVAYELVRPLHLYGVYYAKSLALKLIPMLMRSFPIWIIAGIFLDLSAPVSWIACLGFGASVLCATLLSASIITIAGITLFWTLSGDGIKRLLPTCASLLSGNLIPLPLFPSWMQGFLNWQPFRGIIDIPCRIYTGVIPSEQIFFYLCFQLIWALLLIGFGNALLNRATRRLIIQGG